ncbi:MAG: right-handed parallel beta-helix repeat-containing protein [Anaerolineaceae bacterium]|nr:right-handed parallel beta-helix repeat-containing protein [Anaerolineaceae bacterium]
MNAIYKSRFGKLLSVLTLILCVTQTGIEKVQAERGLTNHFVSPTGSGTTCTQAAPCTFTTAFSNAGSNDTVYFAAGTYTSSSTEVILLNKSLNLIGGWNGNTGVVVADPKSYVSVIDGGYSRRCMVVTGASLVARVMGFTFINGYDVFIGAGISLESGSVTFINNLIKENHAGSAGGGMFITSAQNVTIMKNTFDNNSAYNSAGAIHGGFETNLTVMDNLFFENHAMSGSAIHVDRGTINLYRNFFDHNLGGATVDLYGSSLAFEFINNIVANSMDSEEINAAIGLNVYENNLLTIYVYHNTFSNLSTGITCSWGQPTLVVSNNIFSFSDTSISCTSPFLSGSNNLFYSNMSDLSPLAAPVLGDPQFKDPENGDFHISSTSAALDAGANLAVDTDFEGHHRPTGLGYDIGADERCFPAYMPILFK